MKTTKDWKQILSNGYSGYDEDIFYYSDDEDLLTGRDVLELVINYEGGLASASEVAELMFVIFDIDLEAVAHEVY